MHRLASVKRTLSVTVILALLGIMLAGASLIPDPCLDDDCCSAVGAQAQAQAQTQAQAQADDCGALCCTGIHASPEEPLVLDSPSGSMPALVASALEPEAVVSDPLIRPPIAA